MAITYHGLASVPTSTNGSNSTSPTAITPPASMSAGDLVIVVCGNRLTNDTHDVSNAGGQTWTKLATVSGTLATTTWFWCVFDGTWDANPSFSHGGTNNTCMMMVFRPTSGYSWEVDVAENPTTFAAPSSPYDVTITGITCASASVAIASWFSRDDNTWALQSGASWTQPTGATINNLAGSDSGILMAYRLMPSGGSSNSPVGRETAVGGDLGCQNIASFKETAASTEYISGTINGVAEVSGILGGKGELKGTIDVPTGSQITGDIKGKGTLAGIIDGIATVSGTLKGKGKLYGTIDGIASIIGDLKEAVAKEYIAGVINGVASVSGVLKGKGALAGTINGVASVSGALMGRMIGASNGVATVLGTLKGKGVLAGIINGVANISGNLQPASAKQYGAGVINGVTEVSGTLKGKGSLTGTINGIAIVSGTLQGKGKLKSSDVGPELIDQANWYKQTYWNVWADSCSEVDGKIYINNGSGLILRKNGFWVAGKTYHITISLIITSGSLLGPYDGISGWGYHTTGTWTTDYTTSSTSMFIYVDAGTTGYITALSIAEYIIPKTVVSGILKGEGKLIGISESIATVSGNLKGKGLLSGVSDGYTYGSELVPEASSKFETDGTPWWSIGGGPTKSWDSVRQCMVVTTSGTQSFYLYKYILTPGKQYRVTLKWRSDTYNWKLSIYGGTLLYYQTPVTTPLWQTVQVIIPTDQTALYIQSSSFNGSIDFDNIFVEEIVNNISGVLKGRGILQGTINGTSEVSGTLRGIGKLQGEINGVATVSATPVLLTQAGVTNGVATVSGTLTGKGRLRGVIDDVAIVFGNLGGKGKLIGLTEGIANVQIILRGKGKLIGEINGIADVEGLLREYIPPSALAGVINGIATVSGTLRDVSTVLREFKGNCNINGVNFTMDNLEEIICSLDNPEIKVNLD